MRWGGSVVCASLSQAGIPQVRNGAQTNGAQTPPTRTSIGRHGLIRWLMKLRAARSNGPGIRYLRYQANFFEPDQLSINHQFPRDGCKKIGQRGAHILKRP
jgi:hypothetical protein